MMYICYITNRIKVNRLFLNLELESETPLYLQIRDQIIEGLACGALRDGESLPSTRQLAMDFGINFHTVNKAYDMLRQEGILRLNRKTGAIVSLTQADPSFALAWTARLRVLLAEAHVKGVTSEMIDHAVRGIMASFQSQKEGEQ